MTYANVFQSIIELKDQNIAGVRESNLQIEAQIEQLRLLIDENHRILTRLEVERAALETTQQATASALQQIEQSVDLIKELPTEESEIALRMFLGQVKEIVAKHAEVVGYIEPEAPKTVEVEKEPEPNTDPSSDAVDAVVTEVTTEEPTDEPDKDPDPTPDALEVPTEPETEETQTATHVISKGVETPVVFPTVQEAGRLTKKAVIGYWLEQCGEDASFGKISEMRTRLVAALMKRQNNSPKAA